jgi:hypothetical protein
VSLVEDILDLRDEIGAPEIIALDRRMNPVAHEMGVEEGIPGEEDFRIVEKVPVWAVDAKALEGVVHPLCVLIVVPQREIVAVPDLVSRQQAVDDHGSVWSLLVNIVRHIEHSGQGVFLGATVHAQIVDANQENNRSGL